MPSFNEVYRGTKTTTKHNLMATLRSLTRYPANLTNLKSTIFFEFLRSTSTNENSATIDGLLDNSTFKSTMSLGANATKFDDMDMIKGYAVYDFNSINRLFIISLTVIIYLGKIIKKV